MEKINDLVNINQLKIYQNEDWFKFSLESVLLPFFVTINLRCKKIMDLCTGNAPIPLILSTRTKAEIVGIEIQEDIYNLAKKSVNINKLDNQISIINKDLKTLKEIYEGDTFDVITVNPPYFSKNSIIKNNDEHKIIARHEVLATLDDICKISVYLLKNNGYLAMVHRTERFLEVIHTFEKYNLIPKRIQFIYPKVNASSNLFMIEAMKNGRNGLKLENPMYIHNNDGTYRDEIKKIFNFGGE